MTGTDIREGGEMRSEIWQWPFVRLWVGSTASGFATWGLPFLLGLALTQGRLDAVQLGTVLAVRTGGFLVGVLFGGVIADRVSRRSVILWASLIAALGILLITGGFALQGWPAWAALWAGAVLSGGGQGACRPAYQALVPVVVGADDLQPANAAMSLSVRIVVLLGPALTGAITMLVGVGPAFVILFAIWLISAFAPSWPETKRTRPATRTGVRQVLTDLHEGLSEARRHPWFMAGLAALTAVIATGYSATGVILPMVSEAHYGGARLLVAAMTAYTLGGVVGAVLIGRVRLRQMGWWALLGLGVYALVPLALLMGDAFFVILAAYFLAGVGIEIFNVQWFTATQREVPEDRLARVSSLDFLCSYGLAPLGLSVIAPLTQIYGIAPILLACAVICAVAAILAAMVPGSRGFSGGTGASTR